MSATNPYSDAFRAVDARIARAAEACGRSRAGVALLAVSKTHPAAAVRALYALGQRSFGENYAQELAAKCAALGDLPDLRWSFIGRVQSNKLKLIVAHAHEIQSVTSLEQAHKIAQLAATAGKVPFPIYLCVNAGGEGSKHGVTLDAVPALAVQIARACPDLALQGLMAIPPPLPPEAGGAAVVPPLYARLAQVAAGIGAGRLSLGMTGDLEAAVAAGSTCVRIGTALFGAREKNLGTPPENPL